MNDGISALYYNTRGIETQTRAGPNWRAFHAPDLAKNFRDWSIIDQGGERVWAYKGKPLFFSAVMKAPGQELTQKDELEGWTAAAVAPIPRPPAGVRIVPTPAGDAYATREGKTLYIFECREQTSSGGLCELASPQYRLSACGGPGRCNSIWKVVTAPLAAKPPNRAWTIVNVDPVTGAWIRRPDRGGITVWAYHGRPLYTYAGDERVGDLNGEGAFFYPVMVNRDRPDT
jgi:predicted lipoprotein with Yx(FWY)xxD motif